MHSFTLKKTWYNVSFWSYYTAWNLYYFLTCVMHACTCTCTYTIGLLPFLNQMSQYSTCKYITICTSFLYNWPCDNIYHIQTSPRTTSIKTLYMSIVLYLHCTCTCTFSDTRYDRCIPIPISTSVLGLGKRFECLNLRSFVVHSRTLNAHLCNLKFLNMWSIMLACTRNIEAMLLAASVLHVFLSPVMLNQWKETVTGTRLLLIIKQFLESFYSQSR